MSTNIVHLLTIAGRAAQDVEAVCEELFDRGMKCPPGSLDSDAWSEKDRLEISQVCDDLLNAARDLPVVHYAQYLDSWTVADSRFYNLKWPDGKVRVMWGSRHGVTFYGSRHSDSLMTQINKKKRTKMYRAQTADRWFLEQVREATEAALWLNAPFLVVSISQFLGPSRYDEEIKASLDKTIRLTNRSF